MKRCEKCSFDATLARKEAEFHIPNLTVPFSRAMDVLTEGVYTMLFETKFLCLRTPVEIGSRFGGWQVCCLGGWGRDRLYYLVMLVKIKR